MMRSFTALLVLTLFSFNTGAQPSGSKRPVSPYAAQVYVEGLGPGIFYSINYDRRLARKEDGFGIRIGAARYRADDGSRRATAPLQLNYLLGRNGRYAEIGAGTTYGGGRGIDNGPSGDFIGTATLGYRRQAVGKKGLTWRLALTPLFVFEPDRLVVLPWIGGSLGFRF